MQARGWRKWKEHSQQRQHLQSARQRCVLALKNRMSKIATNTWSAYVQLRLEYLRKLRLGVVGFRSRYYRHCWSIWSHLATTQVRALALWQTNWLALVGRALQACFNGWLGYSANAVATRRCSSIAIAHWRGRSVLRACCWWVPLVMVRRKLAAALQSMAKRSMCGGWESWKSWKAIAVAQVQVMLTVQAVGVALRIRSLRWAARQWMAVSRARAEALHVLRLGTMAFTSQSLRKATNSWKELIWVRSEAMVKLKRGVASFRSRHVRRAWTTWAGMFVPGCRVDDLVFKGTAFRKKRERRRVLNSWCRFSSDHHQREAAVGIAISRWRRRGHRSAFFMWLSTALMKHMVLAARASHRSTTMASCLRIWLHLVLQAKRLEVLLSTHAKVRLRRVHVLLHIWRRASAHGSTNARLCCLQRAAAHRVRDLMLDRLSRVLWARWRGACPANTHRPIRLGPEVFYDLHMQLVTRELDEAEQSVPLQAAALSAALNEAAREEAEAATAGLEAAQLQAEAAKVEAKAAKVEAEAAVAATEAADARLEAQAVAYRNAVERLKAGASRELEKLRAEIAGRDSVANESKGDIAKNIETTDPLAGVRVAEAALNGARAAAEAAAGAAEKAAQEAKEAAAAARAKASRKSKKPKKMLLNVELPTPPPRCSLDEPTMSSRGWRTRESPDWGRGDTYQVWQAFRAQYQTDGPPRRNRCCSPGSSTADGTPPAPASARSVLPGSMSTPMASIARYGSGQTAPAWLDLKRCKGARLYLS